MILIESESGKLGEWPSLWAEIRAVRVATDVTLY